MVERSKKQENNLQTFCSLGDVEALQPAVTAKWFFWALFFFFFERETCTVTMVLWPLVGFFSMIYFKLSVMSWYLVA